ncbi:DUF1033 family protein [Tetragenococcus halophilus]|uniref:DUF1033 family protein n=1 Tax=Tetragenococcus halophilus TaxID=51669 RepID=UPI001B5E6F33|nr:DUF1033 family protein [Tetragenococcus halophilus]GLL52215.1 DNA-binding protein [Tetragenococcus halophilus]
MYQVITMYGDNEPWWFFEDWQNDIQEETSFLSLDDAKLFFQKKWDLICNNYTYINSKTNFLSAFWNDGEERWCEECDDDLQQYKGLVLLKNYQPITVESERKFYEATNSSGKAKRCKRPGQSIRS